MFKLIVLVLISAMTVGCASNPKNGLKYVTKADIDHCMPVATLSSNGFSLIPPVASLMATSLLEKKAEEYKVNSIEIKQKTGWFNVNIDAIGYQCSENLLTTKSKKTKLK